MYHLFDEVARIKDLYIKAGPSNDLFERWMKSVILRHSPNELVKSLAFELKNAETIEDIHSIITIYLHDFVTGLARGQPGPLICLTTQQRGEDADNTDLQTPSLFTIIAATYSQVSQRQDTAQPEPIKETV